MHSIYLILNSNSAFALHSDYVPTISIAQSVFNLGLVVLGLLTGEPAHEFSHDALIDGFKDATRSLVGS